MELAGGMSFQREHELERLFRDMQGARFHVLRQGPQARCAGAMALGLPVATIHWDVIARAVMPRRLGLRRQAPGRTGSRRP